MRNLSPICAQSIASSSHTLVSLLGMSSKQSPATHEQLNAAPATEMAKEVPSVTELDKVEIESKPGGLRGIMSSYMDSKWATRGIQSVLISLAYLLVLSAVLTSLPVLDSWSELASSPIEAS